MSAFIQPTFQPNRLEVHATGRLRAVHAAHIAHLLTVGRQYYRYTAAIVRFDHVQASPRARRLLRSAIDTAIAGGLSVELVGDAMELHPGHSLSPREQRANRRTIGFGRGR